MNERGIASILGKGKSNFISPHIPNVLSG